MRRKYIMPSILVDYVQCERLIAESGVSSDIGIDYGGKVGEEDNINPEVKTSHNFGDENW